MQLYDNGVALGNPLNLANGSADFSTASLPPGDNQITARYRGDNTYAASTSAPVNVVIEPMVDLELGNLGSQTFDNVTKQTIGGLVTATSGQARRLRRTSR